ncbi:MAG: glucosaminidase domain-containing protein [Bacteroidota bacterium]
MKYKYSKTANAGGGQSRYRNNFKGMDSRRKKNDIPEMTIPEVLKRFGARIQTFLIALKYQIYKSSPEELRSKKLRLTWLKVGAAAILIFLLTQKDIQFSFNMKAPLEEDLPAQQSAIRTSETHQMGVAKAMTAVGNNNVVNNNSSNYEAISEEDVLAYIRRFSKVASIEMQKYGIPASVKMAWGILCSKAGTADHLGAVNNHFGDIMNGQQHSTAWENWRAHSVLIHNAYPGLIEQGINYKNWCNTLDNMTETGYAQLGRRLAQIIRQYQLERLDQGTIQ